MSWNMHELLWYDKRCPTNKYELIKLFPEYKEQWNDLLKNDVIYYGLELVAVAWANVGYEAGGSMLVTPMVNGEHPIITKETFKEQAEKYDKLVGEVHDFDIAFQGEDLAETNKFPISQVFVTNPDGNSDEKDEFLLKYGTDEEKAEIIRSLEPEESGEYYMLDMSVWEPVKMDRGENKGKNPVVTSQGNVAVGRKYAGQDVRVFVRKH